MKPEKRIIVTVWTYSMPNIDQDQGSSGKRSTLPKRSCRVNWPGVVKFLRDHYGSLPDVSAAISARLGRQVSRHRLQAMLGKGWQPHWQPVWDVGDELLAMQREAEEKHDTERAA